MVSNFYDSGRDSFLVTSTSKPPSKFDSIEYLEHDVCESSTIAFKTSSASSSSSSLSRRRKARRQVIIPGERPCVGRDLGSSSSNNSTTTTTFAPTTTGPGGLISDSGESSTGVNSEVTHDDTTCWRAEVSSSSRVNSKPSTAPSSSSCRWTEGANSPFKTPAGLPKSFFWGPKVARQRQETERNIRRTNKGEPATFAIAVDECPSTVSTIRSAVPRGPIELASEDDSTVGGPNSAYWGMEPYVHTSITDRAHDGIYDIDTAHKATLAGRVKRGVVPSPHISGNEKQLTGGGGCETPPQGMEPGCYDAATGIDATNISSTFLSLPRQKCNYDAYIRGGLGQTTGSALGPGTYGRAPATSLAQGLLEFSPAPRWNERPSTTTGNASSNKGPWDDVEHAWGRGGYIERAVDRDCGSYLPTETLSYANDLDIDHLGKETLTTAMRRSPKRYAASFSNTQEPNWRVTGDPSLGPGTYAVDRADGCTFLGGVGNADPARRSPAFRARHTPFDLRYLADGYKTLKPRFSTPRSALYTSELSGPPRAVAVTPTAATTTPAERVVGSVMHDKGDSRRRQCPVARAAAVQAVAAAADPWGVGGRDSHAVHLERPSVLDPVRDGSRRHAAAVTWNSFRSVRDGKRGAGRGFLIRCRQG